MFTGIPWRGSMSWFGLKWNEEWGPGHIEYQLKNPTSAKSNITKASFTQRAHLQRCDEHEIVQNNCSINRLTLSCGKGNHLIGVCGKTSMGQTFEDFCWWSGAHYGGGGQSQPPLNAPEFNLASKKVQKDHQSRTKHKMQRTLPCTGNTEPYITTLWNNPWCQM